MLRLKTKIVVPLKLKLFLPVMIIVITVVTITTLWLASRSVKSFDDQIINRLELEVQTITKMFERESILKLEKVQTNLKVANIHFFSKPLQITDRKLTIEVENQQTNTTHITTLPVWRHDGKELYNNYDFVDFLEEVIGGSITIFQKIDSGFVRISTNIRKSDSLRAVGTYIPNNSVVAETVLKGKVYYGRAVVVDEWYTTAYEPIIVDGNIVGMLYVGDKEKDMQELERILNKLKIGKSGYPFVFDKNGILLIHPTRKGEQWQDSTFMSGIFNTSSGTLDFMQGDHKKTVAYRYFDQFDLFVAASILNDVENRDLVRYSVSGALLIGALSVLFLLIFVYRFTTDRLFRYLNALDISKAKLATAEEALKQSEKLAHMGQISAGIAHELNNPLGVITMYSNIILDDLPEGNPVRDDVKIIVEQAERCKNIVGGLLNFARKNKIVAKDVNVIDFLRQSLNSVVIPPGIKAEVHADIDDPMLMIDTEQMTQVFTNLEKNSIDAMPEGGRLDIYIKGNEREIEVTVSDTGSGISKEHIDKLFTPFFTTKPPGKGTGLGLPLIYGIVKMHNGKISVKTNTNPDAGQTGTRFIITLPRYI